MAENTKIQWASHSWSPWRGCAKVSPGCQHCYAEKLSHRNPAVLGEWGANAKRVINADWSKPLAWDRKAAKLGERHRVFPSLCDPFEDREDLDVHRMRLLSIIGLTPNLDWLLLTKRPESWRTTLWRSVQSRDSNAFGRAAAIAWLDGNPPANLWLGVSVENQEYADKRLPVLQSIPAAAKWVSYEPALSFVDFAAYIKSLDWIVVGGESGPGARPFNLAWALSTVDVCGNAGIAPYVKQLGANAVRSYIDGSTRRLHLNDPKGGDPSEWPESLRVREFPSNALVS